MIRPIRMSMKLRLRRQVRHQRLTSTRQTRGQCRRSLRAKRPNRYDKQKDEFTARLFILKLLFKMLKAVGPQRLEFAVYDYFYRSTVGYKADLSSGNVFESRHF